MLDWNGRVLARHEGYGFPDGVFDMAEAEGGVLLAGRDSESDNAHAKIMKLDGVPGKTLWETTLDYQWPDTRYAEIESAFFRVLKRIKPYTFIISNCIFWNNKDVFACIICISTNITIYIVTKSIIITTIWSNNWL